MPLITIHRSSCALYRGDDLYQSWDRYTFAPSPRAVQLTPTGFGKVRSASAPIAVKALVGSRMVGGRLVTSFNAYGLDARNVYELARTGKRGFRLAAQEVTA